MNNISTIFTIIGISGLSILNWIFNKTTRKLTFEIMLNSSLVNKNGKDKIEIMYNNHKLSNPTLMYLKFKNTLKHISDNDFENDYKLQKRIPIKINFSNNSKVIDVGVHKAINAALHNSLKGKIEYEENVIYINPLVLNKNDYFVLKIVIDGCDKEKDIEVHSRIVGINKIHKTKVNNNFIIFLQRVILLLIYTILFAVGIVILVQTGFDMILLVGCIYVFIMSIYSIYQLYKYKFLE